MVKLISEMNVNELKKVIINTIDEKLEEKLRELFTDSDEDFAMKKGIKERLNKSFKEEEKGIKGVEIIKACKQLGLKWK